MERRLIAAISEALGVWIEHHPLVKHDDRMALFAEADSLITEPIAETGTLPIPTFGPIDPMSSEEYERLTRRASVRHLASVAYPPRRPVHRGRAAGLYVQPTEPLERAAELIQHPPIYGPAIPGTYPHRLRFETRELFPRESSSPQWTNNP